MNNWEQVFYSNISTYIGLINKTLSTKFPLTKLGQYIKLKGGYAFKSSEYKTTGIPVIRISDFQNEKIVLDNVKYYQEDDNLKKYELYEGDIIIAMTGGTIGKLAIVQSGLGKLYLNQRVGKFEVINNDDFIQEYVYWIARGVESKVKELAWGGAQPNVSSKQIENMEFSLPDKETQKNVIIFLNDLKNNSMSKSQYFDKECEENIINLQNSGSYVKRLNEEIQTQETLLNKLRQSILQEAIEGKLTADWRAAHPDVEPASVLLEKIRTEKERLVKEKKIRKQKPLPPIEEGEVPFEIPENWEWCRLGAICYVIAGNNFKSEDFNKKNGVRTIKISNAGVNELVETDDFLPYGFDNKYSEYLVKENDLIIALTRPYIAKGLKVSKCNLKYHNSLLNQRVASIKNIYNINNEYLYLYMKSDFVLHGYKNKFEKANLQPNLKMSDITELNFPLPPLQEQKEIVKKIENLFSLCDAIEAQIDQSKTNSESLMQAVLREAFEG